MMILDIVYNSLFANIVFYLDKAVYALTAQAFLDFKIPLIYNVLVYVLMEFREHE